MSNSILSQIRQQSNHAKLKRILLPFFTCCLFASNSLCLGSPPSSEAEDRRARKVEAGDQSGRKLLLGSLLGSHSGRQKTESKTRTETLLANDAFVVRDPAPVKLALARSHGNGTDLDSGGPSTDHEWGVTSGAASDRSRASRFAGFVWHANVRDSADSGLSAGLTEAKRDRGFHSAAVQDAARNRRTAFIQPVAAEQSFSVASVAPPVPAALQVAALAALPPASMVLSDFSNFASQNPFFGQTWDNPAQFSQGAGFASIQPVGGGNPKDDGNFLVVPANRNFSSFRFVEITARVDSGNATASFNFYLEDNSGGVRSVPFTIASFGSSFSTLSAALPTAGIDLTDILFWGISTSSNPVSDFRVSFDNVALTVPEPSAGLLILLGVGLFGFGNRRRCVGIAKAKIGSA